MWALSSSFRTLFQFSIYIIERLCVEFPGQSEFLPMGLKSKRSRHGPNMRMALAARMWDRPARDSIFMCLNPGDSRWSSASLKKGIAYVSFVYRHDRSLWSPPLWVESCLLWEDWSTLESTEEPQSPSHASPGQRPEYNQTNRNRDTHWQLIREQLVQINKSRMASLNKDRDITPSMESMEWNWLYYISCNISHIHININIKQLIIRFIVMHYFFLDMQSHWAGCFD
jgi:hypothetical protein